MTSPPPLDSVDLWGATMASPEHLFATHDEACDVMGPSALGARRPSQVALVGTGSSRTAAAAAAAWSVPAMGVPVWVGEGPELPAFVGPETLVVALSHDGDQPDTVAAAAHAIDRGATVVGLSDGRPRSALAALAGLTHCPVGVTMPNARTAVSSAVVGVAVALWRAGLIEDPMAEIWAAARGLRRRRDAFLAPDAAPERVARRIGRTIPLVYAAGPLAALAAVHWKSQINENVKSPAFSAPLSDVAAHEVVGWGQHGDVTRQVFTLVALRQGGETPASAALFDSVLAATTEVMADVITVQGDGASELARFFDLVLFGDLVSLHMARREEIDPGPVAAWADVAAGPQ